MFSLVSFLVGCVAIMQLGLMLSAPPASAVPAASAVIWRAPVVPGDVNGDGAINTIDLNLIRQSYGMPVTGPDDPRDVNKDGVITVNDVRAAQARCTKPGCAI